MDILKDLFFHAKGFVVGRKLGVDVLEISAGEKVDDLRVV